MSRNRNYAFTWNNYPIDWSDVIDQLFTEKSIKYIIGGEEIGESGTPHIQGHIDLASAKTISALQKTVQRYGMKCAIKTCSTRIHAENNRKYCMKDDKFKEWGTPPCQGKRNDLQEYMDDVKENPRKKRRLLMEEHSSVMARYPRFADTYKMLVQQLDTLDWPEGEPPNLWIWGPPGSGKSKLAREKCEEEPFDKPISKWWDGYDAHDYVIIEEWSPDYRGLATLLKRWSDRYPVTVDIKGSAIKIRPKVIIITSNYSIEECFNHTDSGAIRRRFREIHQK